MFHEQNPKLKKKTKVKVKITTEIKPPKKEKVKTRKGKRKNEINIGEVSKKTKNSTRESKTLSVNQIVEKKYNKTRKKAVKDLVDFNNFLRDVVVEQSQMTVIDDEQKKAVNLYNALVNDSKRVFYDRKNNKTLIK